jgi:ribosomal protein S12 methylthiotransferase accessory factor
MTTKTYVKGKDCDLETSIANMQAALAHHQFSVQDVSWLNPVPNCYSVHLQHPNCAVMYTNGKGATPNASMASALGEFLERLSNDLFFADYYLGQLNSTVGFVHSSDERWFVPSTNRIPSGILTPELLAYFNPEQELTNEHLRDFNSGPHPLGICTLPFTEMQSNKTVYFPVNLLYTIFASNGMAAGNTPQEAQTQALSEIVERYVKNKVISEAICLPEIPVSVLQKYPETLASCAELEKHGFYLRICDASLGGKFPVICITLTNPKDGGVFCSFGSHPCFKVALERTITELLQGRSTHELEGLDTPTFEQDSVAAPDNLESHFVNSTGLLSFDFFKTTPDFGFCEWDLDSHSQDECNYLCQIIAQEGFSIYLREMQHLSMYTCRIIIPGMSDIYPIDDLVWNNNNVGAQFREAFLNLTQLQPPQWLGLLDSLEEGGYADELNAAQFIGLLPDAHTLWETITLGEIKALLCVALQQEQALDRMMWCMQLTHINTHTRKQYRCLYALLAIHYDATRRLENYTKALEQLYGKELLDTCLSMVQSRSHFVGLHCPGLSLTGFSAHLQLLAQYEKVQKAK